MVTALFKLHCCEWASLKDGRLRRLQQDHALRPLASQSRVRNFEYVLYLQSSRQPTTYYAAPAGPAMPAALPAYVAPAPAASSSYGMAYSSSPSSMAPQQSPADALASVKVRHLESRHHLLSGHASCQFSLIGAAVKHCEACLHRDPHLDSARKLVYLH